LRFGILPRRLDGRGGASVVAAMDAAEPKEIPMPKAKSKRKTTSRSNSSRTTGRNSAAQTTARKTAKLKPGTHFAAPDAVEQLLAREHSAGTLHQELQQAIFGRPQIDGAAIARDPRSV
jgi:hypothetical protein